MLTGPQHPPSHSHSSGSVTNVLLTGPQHPPSHEPHFGLVSKLLSLLSGPQHPPTAAHSLPPSGSVSNAISALFRSLSLSPVRTPTPSHCRPLPPSVWISHQCDFGLVLKHLPHVYSLQLIYTKFWALFLLIHSLPPSGSVTNDICRVISQKFQLNSCQLCHLTQLRKKQGNQSSQPLKCLKCGVISSILQLGFLKLQKILWLNELQTIRKLSWQNIETVESGGSGSETTVNQFSWIRREEASIWKQSKYTLRWVRNGARTQLFIWICWCRVTCVCPRPSCRPFSVAVENDQGSTEIWVILSDLLSRAVTTALE